MGGWHVLLGEKIRGLGHGMIMAPGGFCASRWSGIVRSSDELEPSWFPVDSLPLHRMWDDEQNWLHRVLTGQRLPPISPSTSPADRPCSVRTSPAGPDPDLLRSVSEPRVIGHRDPNLANYLWNGTRVRVVDFEDADADAKMSDPATEVAILAEHLSSRGIDSDALCSRFEVEPVRLVARRLAWAIFWLRMLLVPAGQDLVHTSCVGIDRPGRDQHRPSPRSPGGRVARSRYPDAVGCGTLQVRWSPGAAPRSRRRRTGGTGCRRLCTSRGGPTPPRPHCLRRRAAAPAAPRGTALRR